MDFKKMTNFELLKSTENAVETEKAYTLKVLKHLEEIEKRKAFAEFGYASLYDYCLYKLKYSEMEAIVRLNTMRLMRRDKTIEKKIEKQELSLTNANKIQSFARKSKLPKKEILDLVSESTGKSSRQVEAIIEKAKKIQPNLFLQEKIIRLAPSPAKKFDKAKGLIGNYTDAEIVEILIDQKLREPRKPGKESSKFGRYISKELKDFIYKRANHCCEFKNCNEKRFLQIDHIVPVAKGGENTAENLRVLCAGHNQYARVQSFGAKGFT